MDAILTDLRHAFRGLLARPTYAVVVSLTIALVIAASTAVLAVANETIIGPQRFPQGDRNVQLFLMPPGRRVRRPKSRQTPTIPSKR